MTDDMRPLDLERIHQRDHVVGHAVHGEPDPARVALADAPVIMSDHIELFRERRHWSCQNEAKPARPEMNRTGKPTPCRS
jgi:hypothetical protein